MSEGEDRSAVGSKCSSATWVIDHGLRRGDRAILGRKILLLTFHVWARQAIDSRGGWRVVARASHIHIYVCLLPGTNLWPPYYLYINNTDYPPIIQEASHSRGFRCLSRALCTPCHPQPRPRHPHHTLKSPLNVRPHLHPSAQWGWGGDRCPACAVITFLPTGQSGFSASADGWGAATPRVLHYLVILARTHKIHPTVPKYLTGWQKWSLFRQLKSWPIIIMLCSFHDQLVK